MPACYTMHLGALRQHYQLHSDMPSYAYYIKSNWWTTKYSCSIAVGTHMYWVTKALSLKKKKKHLCKKKKKE